MHHGLELWRIAWEVNGHTLERPEALQLYEDAYYEHFRDKPDLLAWLTTNYADVYDTAPSNIQAKCKYEHQETESNHIHDIAIRRAVLRKGAKFTGTGVLEVRGNTEGGRLLSPCKIPFHLPHLIYQGETLYQGKPRDFIEHPPWWDRRGVPNSVEKFYQQNKVLQVKA